MIIRRADVYRILRAQLSGDYSIGFHGITSIGPRTEFSQFSDEEISIAAENIREHGLMVYNNRTINGTVAFFGRIDDADNQDHILNDGVLDYNYGNREIVVIAIPVTIRSEDGRSLYLGDSLIHGEFSKFQGTQGYQTSTLRDDALSGSILPNRYVLGTYKLLPDGMVDFHINKEHMSFKGDVIDNESFDKIKEEVTSYITLGLVWPLGDLMDTSKLHEYEKMDANERLKMYEELKKLLASQTFPRHRQEAMAAYLETLKQYIHEPQIRKLESQKCSDIDSYIEELSQECEVDSINQMSILEAREITLAEAEKEGSILDDILAELENGLDIEE